MRTRLAALGFGVILFGLALALPSRGADWPFVANTDGGTNKIPMIVTITNGNSTASSALSANKQWSIQCKSAARYRPCTFSTCVAGLYDYLVPTNGMDVPLTTDYLSPASQALYLAFYADGSDTTCSIFEVFPGTLPGFTAQ